MGLKNFVNQIVYALSTDDRYAEYNSYSPQNHHQHHAAENNSTGASNSNRQEIELNESNTFEDSESSNVGVSEALLAWRHIETWTSENHSDLNATLADPVTRMDISKAEEDLGLNFPAAVRASFRIHDGQEGLESLVGSGGLFFGLRLMDLNEVVSTTKQWKLVANKLELDERVKENKLAREALISPTGSSLSLDKNRSTLSLNETTKGYGKLTTDENSIDPDLERKISGSHERVIRAPHAPKQRSIPPGAVKPLFANSSWIPLITDDSGNHIGVDLDPDQQGSLGQVILFGREFDTKFVLAPNWGDFLLSFVKELENGNYLIHSEVDDVFAGEGELVFFDKAINREVQYLSYLTHRVLAYWRSQNPQPKRQQPQQQQQQQQQQQGSSSSSQQQAPVEKKTLVPHIAKKEERIISHDITSTNDEDTKQDVKLLDTGDKDSDDEAKEPVKTETKLVDTDAGADAEEDVPNKSQDITEASLSNDFKDVSI